jgi:hypothetical protein
MACCVPVRVHVVHNGTESHQGSICNDNLHACYSMKCASSVKSENHYEICPSPTLQNNMLFFLIIMCDGPVLLSFLLH